MWTVNRLARWPMLLRTDSLQRRGNDRRSLFSSSDVLRYQRCALRQAVELLVEGRIVVVFPEGYPNIDPTYTPKSAPDQFLPFKSGFVNILRAAESRLGTRIPIIPAGLRYQTGNIWTGYLTFGEPICHDQGIDRDALIGVLEKEVKKLSGFAVDENPLAEK
jgi:putative membrane protein